MNYIIITNENVLTNFVNNWLPELKTNECYYFCLFARRYAKNEDGQINSHIKTDKSQLKRLEATRKEIYRSQNSAIGGEVGGFTKLRIVLTATRSTSFICQS